MKRFTTLLVFVFFMVIICLAYDHMIFRDGREMDVNLYQITDDKIYYGYIGEKINTRHETASKDVFMVYIEKQGNVYITPEGKRITGESQRADAKKYHVIYLVKGAEIAADNIRITENDIQYAIKIKGKVTGGLLDKSEVFKIRYKSGMSDIITPIEIKEELKDAKESEADSTAVANSQPQYTVIFHAVAKGENLEKLSEQYNVKPEEIIEWNDLPRRTKSTAPLTAGIQLMIYQLKK